MDPTQVAESVSHVSWNGVFAQLGVVAVLVWYLWYTTSVSFPRMQTSHDTKTQAIIVKHDDTIREIVEKFDKTIRDERSERRTDLTQLAKDLKCPHLQEGNNKR